MDIITAAMGHALASVGGFCTGSAKVVDHQVQENTSLICTYIQTDLRFSIKVYTVAFSDQFSFDSLYLI